MEIVDDFLDRLLSALRGCGIRHVDERDGHVRRSCMAFYRRLSLLIAEEAGDEEWRDLLCELRPIFLPSALGSLPALRNALIAVGCTPVYGRSVSIPARTDIVRPERRLDALALELAALIAAKQSPPDRAAGMR